MQLSPEIAMHWLCSKFRVGKAAFPCEARQTPPSLDEEPWIVVVLLAEVTLLWTGR